MKEIAKTEVILNIDFELNEKLEYRDFKNDVLFLLKQTCDALLDLGLLSKLPHVKCVGYKYSFDILEVEEVEDE